MWRVGWRFWAAVADVLLCVAHVVLAALHTAVQMYASLPVPVVVEALPNAGPVWRLDREWIENGAQHASILGLQGVHTLYLVGLQR